MVRFTELVSALPSTVPFVGPETQERQQGRPFRARLGANENVFGPSPKAIDAMGKAAHETWQYADPENHDLKIALARHHGVEPKNIVIGEGIDGLLGLLVRMLVTKDVPVVTSLGAYPTFNFHVAGFDGRLETVAYKQDCEDPDALLAKVKETNAPLVYFSNPDNPMGTFHKRSVVQEFIDQIPDDTVLCLDEAYCEFAPCNELPVLDVDRRNIIRMRTFSKAYGMAGARIGYAIAHEDLALAFNKVRNHFGMNRIGIAGALAALADKDWLQKTIANVHQANEKIADIARQNDLMPLPTCTNFVAIDCHFDSEFSQELVQELAKRDLFVRRPFVAPQDRCIRISAGRDEDLDYLADILPQALASVRGHTA